MGSLGFIGYYRGEALGVGSEITIVDLVFVVHLIANLEKKRKKSQEKEERCLFPLLVICFVLFCTTTTPVGRSLSASRSATLIVMALGGEGGMGWSGKGPTTPMLIPPRKERWEGGSCGGSAGQGVAGGS